MEGILPPDADAPARSHTSFLQFFGSYYRTRRAWVVLLIFTVPVAYGGGAVMFWFHALYLGEGGPAISPWLHWALDSTVGFVGLTPIVGLAIPLGLWLAAPRPTGFAMMAGGIVAVATAPAPFVHDNFVGRETWLAEEITQRWGTGTGLPPRQEDLAGLAEAGQQVLAGLPTYIVIMWITLLLLRAATRTARA